MAEVGRAETDAPERRGGCGQHLVGSNISDADFSAIHAILLAGRGFDLNGYKDRCIKRRIAARIRSLGCQSIADYVLLLSKRKSEQDALIEALSIHVSQFFRNPTTFAVLEQEVLPELLLRQRDARELRIWSVGCAGGEEPYSLALLCDELCESQDRVSILGTDVSAEVLKRARGGLFGAARLAEVPESVQRDYFSPEGNAYRLVRRIREKVRFFRHDILRDRPFQRVDLILCRNMLIYFTRQEQERILGSLAAALTPGGLLVLGRSESLISDCRDLFTCVDPAERIYRKRDAEIFASD